ncbi:MAG: glycosyltransferase [Candidatus Doudnabacteria bacterium]
MDLSVIIVPYKCKDDLDVTLEAVFASQTKYSYEVIIIDNDSQDGTTEMVQEKYMSRPELTGRLTYQLNTNEGFGKGNNRGMKIAKGDYFLLLNPDTKVDPDNIEVMMDFIKSRSDVGIATCKLIRPDGKLDPASRRDRP